MSKIEQIKSDFVEAMTNAGKEGTTPYDTEASVVRVDGSTAWVHIPGGVTETPVAMTINCVAGDKVQVRVSGGSAWLTGNETAPPTDDRVAKVAQNTAVLAEGTAAEAKETAEQAQAAAGAVIGIAQHAEQIAGNTAQHFWFTSTGADTGAHITEVTQEEWEQDPTAGGGNLLARTNGIAVRNGLAELATFGNSGISVGITDGTQNYMLIDYHSMKMINKDGDTYFHISDLRNTDGNLVEEFTGDGITTAFKLMTTGVTQVVEVTLNGTPTTAYTWLLDTITFSTAPINNTSIVVTYKALPARYCAFTFGNRKTGGTIGRESFVEGASNIASSFASHAEGNNTIASGGGAHAEGYDNTASGSASHAEGQYCTAEAYRSHAQNFHTIAGSDSQTTMGKYNEVDRSNKYALIVGNGATEGTRSNALALAWDGETELALDTTAASGTDYELYTAITSLGWASDVIA